MRIKLAPSAVHSGTALASLLCAGKFKVGYFLDSPRIISEFIRTNMQFSQDSFPEHQDITLGSATDEAVLLTTKYVSPNNMSSTLGKYESCFIVTLYAEAYISTY